MNLALAYQNLFTKPGYSFIYTGEGEYEDWRSNFMGARGLRADDSSNKTAHGMHVVPGSFNPLHLTHKEIYNSAVEQSSPLHVFFEMSVERVDKAMVTLPELHERLKQFDNLAPVIVSRAPRFVTKIGTYLSHVNDLIFHVGIDTIVRMKDDYGLWGIQGLSANFVVHDRIMNDKLMSLRTEFGNVIPFNCHRPKVERTEESLSRASSKIRNSDFSL